MLRAAATCALRGARMRMPARVPSGVSVTAAPRPVVARVPRRGFAGHGPQGYEFHSPVSHVAKWHITWGENLMTVMWLWILIRTYHDGAQVFGLKSYEELFGGHHGGHGDHHEDGHGGAHTDTHFGEAVKYVYARTMSSKPSVVVSGGDEH